MTPADIARLLTLAAIWGSSFMFMRVLAPVLGPVWTADLRILIAGAALLVYYRFIGLKLDWRRDGKDYLIIGIGNSALPFCLFSFAALHIPAGYSAILNATAPLWGAVFAALWLREPLTRTVVMGLALGLAGVATITGAGAVALTPLTLLAVLACLGAAACYALTGIYMKRCTTGLKPLAIAGASQFIGGIVLALALPAAPPTGTITLHEAWLMLAFSLSCSAVAYVLYYRLMADLGPTRALTVTFIVPLFGMLWGSLLLGEPITPRMVLGFLLVIGSVLLIMRKPKLAGPT